MRTDNQRTTFEMKDLSEQPKGAALLIFKNKWQTSTVLWVDGVSVSPGAITGFRRIISPSLEAAAVPVVEFSPDHTWCFVDAEYLNTFQIGEYLEAERANIMEREQTRRDLSRIYKIATEGEVQDDRQPRLFQEPPQPDNSGPFPPKADKPFDPDAWLRNQLGDEDDPQKKLC